MKRVLLFVAAAALVSGTMASCGKTTKGKMEGEWKMDSMNSTETSTNGGSSSTETVNVEGTVITITSTSGSSTVTTTGVVNEAKWTINKDGTWERVMSITFAGSGYSSTSVQTTSGNWDFATGVGEFKKNERVIFSTTSDKNDDSNTVGSSTTTSSSTQTYADGENTEVFVVTESKGKSLSMKMDKSNSSTSGGSTSTTTGSTTVTMSL